MSAALSITSRMAHHELCGEPATSVFAQRDMCRQCIKVVPHPGLLGGQLKAHTHDHCTHS